LRRWYKYDLDEAVRDVMFQRRGGIIGVIDAITEGLLGKKNGISSSSSSSTFPWISTPAMVKRA